MKLIWILPMSLLVTNSPWCSAFVPTRLRGQSPTFVLSSTSYLDNLHAPPIATDLGNDEKEPESFEVFREKLMQSFDSYVDGLPKEIIQSPTPATTDTKTETKEQFLLFSSYLISLDQSFSSYVDSISQTAEQSPQATQDLDSLAKSFDNYLGNLTNSFDSYLENGGKDENAQPFSNYLDSLNGSSAECAPSVNDASVIKKDPVSVESACTSNVIGSEEQAILFSNYLDSLNQSFSSYANNLSETTEQAQPLSPVVAEPEKTQNNVSFLDNLSTVKSEPISYPTVTTVSTDAITETKEQAPSSGNYLDRLNTPSTEPATQPISTTVSTVAVTEIKEQVPTSDNYLEGLSAPSVPVDLLSRVRSEQVTGSGVNTVPFIAVDNVLSNLEPKSVSENKEGTSSSGNKYLKLNASYMDTLSPAPIRDDSGSGLKNKPTTTGKGYWGVTKKLSEWYSKTMKDIFK